MLLFCIFFIFLCTKKLPFKFDFILKSKLELEPRQYLYFIIIKHLFDHI